MDLSKDPNIKKSEQNHLQKPVVWKYYIDDIFPYGTKI